jgi:hypothetical protein
MYLQDTDPFPSSTHSTCLGPGFTTHPTETMITVQTIDTITAIITIDEHTAIRAGFAVLKFPA